MGRHISEIGINSYRSIKNFHLDDLADINIFVGENNCGKTSLLEAIQILNRPDDIGNIIMVTRQRDSVRTTFAKYTQVYFSSFLNAFSKYQNDLSMSMYYKTNENKISFALNGEITEALMSEDQLTEINKNVNKYINIPAIDEKIKTFIGKLTVNYENMALADVSTDIKLNRFNSVMRLSKSDNIKPMSFLSPIEHIVNDRFNEIIKTKSQRDKVINILQTSFDINIQDLRLIEDDSNRIVRMVEHKIIGDMPLSTYGDGIKKVIALANAAATIKNGILLVDEYETAIHPQAMDLVFRFIKKTCMDRNIQLFITTHSDEALDKMLQDNDDLKNIRVITMYKNADKTTARVLDGEKALLVKNELGLELR